MGPIGVFDSGVGGLTVAKGIKDLLPDEQVLYFGDTAHLPYGDKSRDSIVGYLINIFKFMHEMNCKLVVIACNSASSVYDLDKSIIPVYNMPVIDVISPVVRKTVDEFRSGTIGVIGTRRTIESAIYKLSISDLNPGLIVKELATPLLAPMIEDGFIHNKIAKAVIDDYLSQLGKVDSLILGCTHYPLIRQEIEAYYDHKTPLIDAPKIIAAEVKKYINTNNLRQKSDPGPDQFYVSDFTKTFEETAKQFFGSEIRLNELKLNE